MPDKNNENKKLQIDIFVPLDACACTWEQFMNLVFGVLIDYRDKVNYQTKNLNSEEARELNLNSNSVVVDGKHVFKTSFMLKKKLPEILRKKG